MVLPTSVKASPEGLNRVDRARRRMGLSRTRSEVWWLEAEVSQSTLRRFWSGKSIRRDNFIAVCQAVGIEQWQEIVDWPSLLTETDEAPGAPTTGLVVHTGLESHWEARGGQGSEPPLLTSVQRLDDEDLEEGRAERPILAVLPEFPEGPVAIGSEFYIERQPLEARCWEMLGFSGALIRIKGPRQMGKTSLLNRLCLRAMQQRGLRVVRLNLAMAESGTLQDLDRLLRWLCAGLAQQLRLTVPPRQVWQADRGSIINCMAYVQEQVLETSEIPLVLALDEVDVLFPVGRVSQDFFAMLRSWHEEAKTLEAWGKLRLVVVHSTEIYGQLDINRSPFNVGFPVGLTEFSLAEIEELVALHQLAGPPQGRSQLAAQLMELVGGHPYLVRLALYDLAWQKVLSVEQLLQEAQSDVGIYADNLRYHLETLRQRSELAIAFQQVLTQPEAVALGPLLAYQLYSMGLVRRQGDRVTPRGQLYRQYFLGRLGMMS